MGVEGRVCAGVNMTESEFLQLKIDTVISNRFQKGIYFVIYDADQMGTAYRGERYRIYGARQMDCDTQFVRISIGNCPFWKIEGKISVSPGNEAENEFHIQGGTYGKKAENTSKRNGCTDGTRGYCSAQGAVFTV